MKKLIVFLILGGVALLEKAEAQTISSIFNAQNYWMPNEGPFTGQLQGSVWDDIEASGVKYMRVGGIAYDAVNNTTGTTYVWSAAELASGSGSIIAEIRSHGIEPILQVPIDITQSISTNATNAANLVNAVNNTYGRNVIYWEIGNEPNAEYSGTNNYNTDAKIRDYIQQVSTQMKGVSGQSGIKIIGPSFSYYDFTRYHNLLGGTYDITGSGTNGYYIDYIDFHIYPFQNECYWQTKTPNCTTGTAVVRNDVINNLTATDQLEDILDDIIDRIVNHTSRTTSNLKISITEANISYEQDTGNKLITDLGPGSFLGGQYWAEMMGICMEKGVELLSFWSVVEGYSGNSYLSDIGYIGAQSAKKRPTYWHYKMIAENFAGTFLTNLYTSNGANHKAFAYKNTTTSELGVIVINQDIQSPRGTDVSTKSFRINFNNSTPSGSYDMKFYFNGSASAIAEYSCTIKNEATMLLVFDTNTGVLKKRVEYSLQNALRTTDTGTETIITSSTEYNSYNSSDVHSNIVIGTGSSIGATSSETFKATNSIRLNGPYSSGSQTLSLQIDQTCP